MGFLDGTTAGFFKTDSEGRELFFARGRFGRGRIVPSAEDRAALRAYLKAYQVCVIVGAALLVPIADQLFGMHPAPMILLLAALAVVGVVPVWLRVRTWELVDDHLTYRESVTASAMAHSATSLGTLILLAAILLAASLFVALATEAAVIGTIGAAFFGLCLLVLGYMLLVRSRG